ncbi:hypothetical protein HHK36_018139 [Tetracentron sinense]|uniref:C2H2-type domain-containing protein n=1 Tax=Tetracentron sinense TaxID=13715 RepID=A0A834YY03_TETSI|nr:hypothetical protein HHK36_018139 [Tetracentron sinense]
MLESNMDSPQQIMGYSNDHIHIVKGKRTKRQRSSSKSEDDDYSFPSPTTSIELSESTEEEADMANCLILLAQGNGPKKIEDSRRFSESGLYVYECKTCNRCFPRRVLVWASFGGHMRRHRTCTSTTATMNMPTIASESQEEKKSRNVLALDLNLPAPEDDHRESKFAFASNDRRLVFSASALVDCHY